MNKSYICETIDCDVIIYGNQILIVLLADATYRAKALDASVVIFSFFFSFLKSCTFEITLYSLLLIMWLDYAPEGKCFVCHRKRDIFGIFLFYPWKSRIFVELFISIQENFQNFTYSISFWKHCLFDHFFLILVSNKYGIFVYMHVHFCVSLRFL